MRAEKSVMSPTVIGTPISVNASLRGLIATPIRNSGLMGAMTTIGQRIRRIRTERGLTQKQLAAAVGMAQSTLAELEGGASKRTTRLLRIAEALGVSASELDPPRRRKSGSDDDGQPSATVLQATDPVQKNVANESRLSRQDAVKMLGGYELVKNLFEHHKGAIRIESDLDLVERAVEFLEVWDPALSHALEAEVLERLSARGLVSEKGTDRVRAKRDGKRGG